jgi:hypothetical protein
VTAVRVGGVAVLAAVAVLASLLAVDVGAWRNALAHGDRTPSTRLGGTAETLLGTADDVAYRRALRLYRAAATVPRQLDTAVERQTRAAEAETALAGPVASTDATRASQARTLLGILAFDRSADTAIADFTDAVRADPGNEAAKYDLELLLRLTAAHGARPGSGQSSRSGRTGRRGAGGGVPGSGY